MSATPLFPQPRARDVLVIDEDASELKIIIDTLTDDGFSVIPATSADTGCAMISEQIGAMVVAGRSFSRADWATLDRALACQPEWSDLPVVVLSDNPNATDTIWQTLRDFAAIGNVAVLKRPLRPITLTSVVQVAMRARMRQYEMREHIAEHHRIAAQLTEFAETLEQRVTERTAVAERQAAQLRLLASELTQTEQRERRCIAQLLHDHVQQLLVATKMQLSMAMSHTGDASLRGQLKRADGLINDAVDAMRTLTVELSPPILHDAGFVAAMHWLSRHMRDKHGLAVGVDAPAELRVRDPDLRTLLFDAVRELLFNVVKHAGVADATVRAELPDSETVRITVSDTGHGFVTDPTSSGEMVVIGSGKQVRFGLFSIRQRLGLFGGTIDVRSEPAIGTTITIIAPLGDEPSEARRRTKTPKSGTHAATASVANLTANNSSTIRILLADDQKILREGLVALLSDHADFAIVGEAADGEMAVEMARQIRPDVVVMDISMPRMNGIEATRRITTTVPGVQVIGLSMHDHHDVAEAMREAGAVTYLVKGGPSEALIDAIRAFGRPE